MTKHIKQEFADAFSDARMQLSYLDDLDSVLRFPEIYRSAEEISLHPLADLYRHGDFLADRPEETMGPYIIQLANRLCSYRDNTSIIRGSVVAKTTRQLHGLTRNPMPAMGRVGENPPEMHAEFRAMIYDIVSMLVYQEPILDLWGRAQQGDTESFFRLARIDKSVVTADLGIKLVREKQYSADWAFFNRLGKEVSKPPMPDSAYKPLAVILAARFWREEFCRWSREDLAQFMVDHDLLANTARGHDHFRRALNRVGLKKAIGRPKKGQ